MLAPRNPNGVTRIVVVPNQGQEFNGRAVAGVSSSPGNLDKNVLCKTRTSVYRSLVFDDEAGEDAICTPRDAANARGRAKVKASRKMRRKAEDAGVINHGITV